MTEKSTGLDALLLSVAKKISGNPETLLTKLKSICEEHEPEYFKYLGKPYQFMLDHCFCTSHTQTGLIQVQSRLHQQLMMQFIETYPHAVLNVARQMGSTTTLLAYAVYRAKTHPDQLVILAYTHNSQRMESEYLAKLYPFPIPSNLIHVPFNLLKEKIIGRINSNNSPTIIITDVNTISYASRKLLDQYLKIEDVGKWILQGQPDRNDTSWNRLIAGEQIESGFVPLSLNRFSSLSPLSDEVSHMATLGKTNYHTEMLVQLPEREKDA